MCYNCLGLPLFPYQNNLRTNITLFQGHENSAKEVDDLKSAEYGEAGEESHGAATDHQLGLQSHQ